MEDGFTLSTKIPADLNEDFEVACTKRRMKKKPAVAAALREWIDKEARQPSADTPPITKADVVSFGQSMAESNRFREVFTLPEHARLLALLTAILETRNENARLAITSNLEVFAEYAALKGGPGSAKTGKPRRAAR